MPGSFVRMTKSRAGKAVPRPQSVLDEVIRPIEGGLISVDRVKLPL